MFEDPVVAADEHTYSRHAIEEWMAKGGVSPVTGSAFAHRNVTGNSFVEALLQKRQNTLANAQQELSALDAV